MNQHKGKKILICHYRVGRTDGVSLEIEKRQNVLQALGYEVKLVSGPLSSGSDYVVQELEFDTETISIIKRNAFYDLSDFDSGKDLMNYIHTISNTIYEKFEHIINTEKPDMLMLHNIFSHGRHIAAAAALSKIIRDTNIPAIATHHDFFWERPEYENPTCREIEEFLQEYVPPAQSGLRHATINDLAAQRLKAIKNIDSLIIPDTFDFSMDPWKEDSYNADFLREFNINHNDIVLLQATRVVERKGIEIAIELVRRLSSQEYQAKIRNCRLYNGKKTDSESRIILIIAGYAEKDAENYLSQLKDISVQAKIEARFIGDRIAAQRSQTTEKNFSLWDCYVFADAVTYPSLHEGWGNQFIEAVFAKKPIITFEYPVFISDIRALGYNYISLGSTATKGPDHDLFSIPNHTMATAANELIAALTDGGTPKKLDGNFAIGREHNSYGKLEKIMKELMFES